MSFASKATLGAALVFSTGCVVFVHLSQNWERERLATTVNRDIEKEQQRIQNLKLLQENRELEKVLIEQRAQEDRQRLASTQ